MSDNKLEDRYKDVDFPLERALRRRLMAAIQKGQERKAFILTRRLSRESNRRLQRAREPDYQLAQRVEQKREVARRRGNTDGRTDSR